MSSPRLSHRNVVLFAHVSSFFTNTASSINHRNPFSPPPSTVPLQISNRKNGHQSIHQVSQNRLSLTTNSSRFLHLTLFSQSNIPDGVDEMVLRPVVEEHGEVKDISLPRDHDTGKLRGFGSITYADAKSVKGAIKKLDGSE
jgi:RNA recognition motif-containing protein